MNTTPTTAPVLSTPAEHIFSDTSPATVPINESRLSEEQLYTQYEIQRTISEIREGRWKRIALQFPDDMLVDAPRVYERLRDGLRRKRLEMRSGTKAREENVAEDLEKLTVSGTEKNEAIDSSDDVEDKLCILADTSYGACCVDEVAAEHIDAEVVVHYGRACLSPTARLPVIYVFTSKPLDFEAAIVRFRETYNDMDEKICLMADIPYHHHIPNMYERLRDEGYKNVYATEIIRDPSSPLPNRTLPTEVRNSPEKLKEYSVFHISDPPTSLLLILSSRVKRIHILSTTEQTTQQTLEASTHILLRRRYALLTRVATAPIIGILINTLSVSNYMDALSHIQNLVSRAGKKSYTFVVGKVNAAKIANFSEVGGWVVIGCWESSLLESKEFYAPVVTPFELEVALKGDGERLWTGEWVGDFTALLKDSESGNSAPNVAEGDSLANGSTVADWDEQPSDDEPPDFDLRTGRYVSRSRPMGRPKPEGNALNTSSTNTITTNGNNLAPPSSALVQRAKVDVATINGAVSPGAAFLRSQRTWQGLGSDREIAYERDEDGKIIGAAMEEGRSGIARGYVQGDVKTSEPSPEEK